MTFCGLLDSTTKFKAFLRKLCKSPKLMFKNGTTTKPPFRRLKIKRRDEIVTTLSPNLKPKGIKNHHLTPTEWNEVIKTEKDIYLIDARNWYETKLGKFKNAVDPKMSAFTEFPRYIDKQNLPKTKKVLMYCTGGIRCEKGVLELQQKGFQNVYQLKGGILKYLEEYPNDQFDGECFVFDHRVALTQQLEPTKKYQLCAHCGQPGANEIICHRCDTRAKICEECSLLVYRKDTCSKNCAYQWKEHPNLKGPPQPFVFDVPPSP